MRSDRILSDPVPPETDRRGVTVAKNVIVSRFRLLLIPTHERARSQPTAPAI
jgi:hypothetical protein